MPKRLDQAEHNEKLSQKLYDEKVFLDWANTTAFYSALHFVHHKLLPGEFNGQKCNNIDDVLKSLSLKGKHEATNQMVQIGLPAVSTAYGFLMNCSFTARYYDYNVHPEHAKLCQKYLKSIKTICK